ncbi:DUF748 domain-containing protein [Fulvivirga sediminis]|uniref:DUF748 domain-containing protein n=1 Tax=Fulvivirga sediminis TaxID=2803949 RepID=A0A937K100_9BACT|nr:DUF748 domain-containing protein [Fulvivirga sediminis]MBL3658853.1 DUF748 domain-containing protein [Fulvivirga sediminis]
MTLRHKYFKLRSLRRSRRGLLVSLLIFLFVLVFAVLLTYEKLINYYAYDLLGRSIKKTVEIKTDGLYSISYDSIAVDFFKSKATLFEFEVNIDSSKIEDNDKGTLFAAKVPLMEANIINLIEIIFKDELKIKSMSLKDPEVWITQPRRNEENLGLSKESGDVYKTITEQIKAFNLGEFKVNHGKISYKREVLSPYYDFVAGNISFTIKNFGWNRKKANSNQKFYTDHISLMLKDQSFKLRDSIHEVTFDSVLLSTKESKMSLINVHLYPRFDKLNQPELVGKNAYYVEMPALKLRGLNFGKAYDENILDIDSLDLVSPKFAMDNFHGADPNQELSPSTEQLIKIIAQLFNVIQVSNVNINDGNINILRDRATSISRFKARNIFARVKNVKIDTLAYSEIGYDSATVGLKDYLYTMPDSVHVLKFGSLFFTTTDKSNIKVDSVEVFDRLTDAEKREKGGVINIVAPHMEVTGFEFQNFIDNNELVMNKVEAIRPDITYYMKSGANNSNKQFDLPSQVHNIFDLLKADSIKITKGSVRLVKKGVDQVSVKGLKTSIGEIYNYPNKSNLYLDSIRMIIKARQIILQPSGGFYGELSNVTLAQQDIARAHIDRLQINHTKGIAADLYDIETSSQRLAILVNNPEKAMRGVSVRQFKLRLDADKLNSGAGKTSQNHSSTVFSNIKLGKGEVTIIKNGEEWMHTNVKTTGFAHLEIGNETKVDGVYGDFGSTWLNKGEKRISVSNLRISGARNELAVKGLIVGGNSHLSVDSLAVMGADINGLINDGNLYARHVVMRKPKLHLKTVEKSDGSQPVSIEDLRRRINETFNDINVKKVSWDKAHIYNDSGFEISNFSADLKNVKISQEGGRKGKLPFMQSISGNIQEIKVPLKEASVTLKGVVVDSRDDLIKINDFTYSDFSGITSIQLPQLQSSIPDLYKLLEDQRLILNKVTLPHPILKLEKNKDKEDKSKFLSGGVLKSISIKHLDLQHGDLLLKRENKDFELDDFSIDVYGIELDENTDLSDNLLVFNNIRLATPNLTFYTKNKLNKLILGNVKFSSRDSSLTVTDMYFSPVYGRDEFFKHKQYESDYIKADAKTVKLSGINLDKFLNHQIIDSRQLLIENAQVDVFRDKNMPDAPNKEKVMYQMALMQYDRPFNIENIQLRNIDITYNEHAEKAQKPGFITFNDLNADFKNVTNRKDLLRKNKNMTVDVSANVMGKAPLSLSVTFDMLSPEGEFTLGGNMGETSLTVFNDITRNNAFIDVKDGYANSLMFSVKGDKEVAYGNMDFHYEDLKVTILNKHSGDSKLVKSIASFFANTFVINRNNPHLFKFRDGKIYFERNPNKSLFNYWTKSFLSGLVASIGVNNNRKEFEKVTSGDQADK